MSDMKITKSKTETYILTGIKGLDPVYAYVTNYGPGAAKIVIECFSEAWAYYWGGNGR